MDDNGTARFQAGEIYKDTDWFTGGTTYFTVAGRDKDTLRLTEAHDEIDGFHVCDGETAYEICEEDNREYIVLYSYCGNENRIYAHKR